MNVGFRSPSIQRPTPYSVRSVSASSHPVVNLILTNQYDGNVGDLREIARNSVDVWRGRRKLADDVYTIWRMAWQRLHRPLRRCRGQCRSGGEHCDGRASRQRLTFAAFIGKAAINPYGDVPPSVSNALGQRGNVPVRGTQAGQPFRSTLVPRGDGRHRLSTNGRMRQTARADAGDRVAIAIRRDPQPREQPAPAVLAVALRADADARERWQAWTPSRRKEVLVYLNAPKRLESVQRTVGKVLRHQRGGESH